MKFVVTALLSIYFLSVDAQISVEAADVTFKYSIRGDIMICTAIAPTTGWVAVGFNTENNIEGADLKMMRIRAGKAEMQDQFVQAAGVHPPDAAIGGTTDCVMIFGEETEDKTSITFKMPLRSQDKYDHPLKLGDDIWLILAWSVDDDFEHHSRKREHVKIWLTDEY